MRGVGSFLTIRDIAQKTALKNHSPFHKLMDPNYRTTNNFDSKLEKDYSADTLQGLVFHTARTSLNKGSFGCEKPLFFENDNCNTTSARELSSFRKTENLPAQ